jgi:HK97 family phage portal protein
LGLLARAIIEPFERRGVLQNPPDWLRFSLGGSSSASGTTVNALTALGSPAVLAAVRILSSSIASLPLKVYRRTDQGKEPDPEHPLYAVLYERPNTEQTSFEWRELLQIHLLLYGNAYCVIERDRAGRVIELWPLRPDQVFLSRPKSSGPIVYTWRPTATPVRSFSAERILHIRWLCQDSGVLGVSPITLAREAIGLSLASEEYGGRFFSNNANPGGVITHPGELTDEAYKRLKESWEEQHQGLSRAHRAAILEEGMSWTQIGIAPEDAQFLETRKFQVTEIARIFGVQPHLLADLDRATFSNVEHQGTEFLTHTLMPWLVRWEQAIQTKLLAGQTHFVKFGVQAFMRGDTAARVQFYSAGRQWGWLSANDIRELEDQNRIDGGDEYLTPINMESMASESIPERRSRPLPSEYRSAVSRSRLVAIFEPLFLDTAGRLIRAEVREVQNAVKRTLAARSEDDFRIWLDGYYGEDGELREMAARQLGPLYRSYVGATVTAALGEAGSDAPGIVDAEEFILGLVAAFAARHAEQSRGQLLGVLAEPAQDPALVVEARLEEWQATRAEKIAKRETIRANRAAAKKAWQNSGVRRLRWVASGETCPYCSRLNGKIVGIDQHFVGAEETWEAEGREPLRIRRPVGHPPVHQGCDCDIVPA